MSKDRRAWLRTFVEEAFHSRRAARYVDELAAPRHPASARRSLVSFAHRRGLRLGAPVLREEQVVARHAGRLAPLVRYLAVLSDQSHAIASYLGAQPASDADSRDRARLFAVAIAGVLDDETAIEAAADRDHVRATRALTRIGRRLEKRRFLLGNPLLGLTLNHALIAADALAFGQLAPLAFRRVPTSHERQVVQQTLRRRREALVASVASLSAHRSRRDDSALSRTTERWHVRSLGLPRAESQRLLVHVNDPPTVEACAALIPLEDAELMLEHIVLAAHIDGRVDEDEQEWIDAIAAALGLNTVLRQRLERRIARFVHDNREVFNPLDHAMRFEAARPPVAVRFSLAVRQNLDALVREIRETGDLALLLAKRARGPLTADEHKRMRAQLVDVAKAVPSLAVFTLPGGVILVPLLLKLLPFDLRTSAFKGESFRAFEGEEGSLEGAPVQNEEEFASAPAASAEDL